MVLGRGLPPAVALCLPGVGGDLWEAAEPGSAERLPRFPAPLPSPQVCLLQRVKRGGGHRAPVLTMFSRPSVCCHCPPKTVSSSIEPH